MRACLYKPFWLVVGQKILTINASYVPKSVHKMSYNVLENKQKRDIYMSAFDKIIGYEKEKEELYRLCDMAKNPGKIRGFGGKTSARYFAVRRAGCG